MSDETKSVLEENWRAGNGAEAEGFTLYREHDSAVDGRCLALWWSLEGEAKPQGIARRDLAALAPRMARLLRGLEGAGSHRDGDAQCPVCFEEYFAVADPENDMPHVNHKSSCELGAVLAELGRLGAGGQ